MHWWQIMLIVLTSIVTGVIAGGLLSYLITRLLKKPFVNAFVKRYETAPVIKELPKSITTALITEVEINHRIATELQTGKFLFFQTNAWDTSQDRAQALPADLPEDITQAYIDMRVANNVVWLATELGCRSQNLDEKYTQLCTNIAARLDGVVPLLKTIR